jgi:hypothetical protein
MGRFTAKQAYAAFLRSPDLSTWMECLEAQGVDQAQPAASAACSTENIVNALCIAMYVNWLGDRCGDRDAHKISAEVIEWIESCLRQRDRYAPCPMTKYGMALLTAWAGYREAAKDALLESGGIPPEASLLVAPRDNAQMVAFLRNYLTDDADGLFPPVFYFYCSGLLDLGSLNEVHWLVRESGKDESDPMIRDLKGKMHERSGLWKDAYEIYHNSRWPVHRYRAGICRSIEEGLSESEDNQLVSAEEVSRALLDFESEIDQTELARANSFVNACRWNTFDNWILHLELGKLNFRRRRYCEADAHLKRAAGHAPQECRFAIENLRFANLTWISEQYLSRDLPMEPETLEAGYAAIVAAREPEETAGTRVWLAAKTGEKELLQPLFSSPDLFNRGKAYELDRNTPDAIRCWHEMINQKYYPRALQKVMDLFASAGFQNTVDCMVGIIVRESWDDFFVLWELANFLLDTLSRFGETSDGFQRLNERLVQVAQRLQDLSRFEFQHLIRAYEVFSRVNRQDIAESLLARASKLAEGAEENLAIAVARRRSAWFRPNEPDPEGLACLVRAEKEARDRLERLQLAREFFLYGQIQAGRRVLEQEGILVQARDLQPIEFIVAIQCGPWLTQGEFRFLVKEAVDSLFRSLEAGLDRKYAPRFAQRLVGAISSIDESALGEHARLLDLATPGKEESDHVQQEQAYEASDRWEWKTWQMAVRAAKAADDLSTEEQLLGDMLAAVESLDADLKYAVLKFLYCELDEALVEAFTACPKTEPEETPYTKSGKVIGNWRAQILTDLWKAFIASATDKDRAIAEARIRSFHDDERRCLTDWEKKRRRDNAKYLRRALVFGKVAEAILESLLVRGDEQDWRPFSGIHEAIATDLRGMLQRNKATMDEIRTQMMLPSEMQSAASPSSVL